MPEHIHHDYPLFVSFTSAYLEYLEETKNPHDIAINLREYRDSDGTLDEFIELFSSEYMVNIPTDVITDKRLLAKHIKKFYLNKGNEASYKFLFQILYGEDIEFYYPKTDILRASDGKWFEQKSIKITLANQSDLLLFGPSDIVTGQTSSAVAVVESVISYLDRGALIVELSLSDIRGAFTAGELVLISYIDSSGDSQVISENILDIYTEINITAGGALYSIDDLLIVRNQTGNEIGKGVITQVTKGDITGLTIDAAGTNYNGDIKEVTVFYALTGDSTINGDYLPDTAGDGTGTGDSGANYNLYTFDQIIPLQSIIGTGDPIQISDSSTSFGSGAFGVVSKVGNDNEIIEVTLLDGGAGYDVPTAEVISATGTGGEISVLGGGGTITEAKLLDFPIVLGSDIDTNGFTAYPDFTGQGDGLATGEMISEVLGEYPGRYLNEDGHLSSSKKLQDNFFYQDYSYVLKVGLTINNWKDVIKKAIHPAGLVVFGEVVFLDTLEATVTNPESKLIIEIGYEIGAQMSMTEAVIKLYVNDSFGEAVVPVVDTNGNHLIDFQKDSNGEYVPT